MSNKTKIVVFPKLFKTSSIHYLYESIEYFNLKVKNKPTNNHFKTAENSVYSHRLVPEYFKLNLRHHTLKTKIISEFNWGYSILLNPADSIDSFMNRQFNSKKRNVLTRYVKRLEICFDIEYKMFYGDIDKSDYNFVMQSLYEMIVARFNQRNELHKNLHEWDYLLENTYSEIINKNASLFVIYNKDEPIEVSLNYHFDKVLFSYLSSYNVDYSKFGLGHVEIYKQIEWCANNKYILFEMGVGGMDYKRRWSNNIYRYNHHIVYKNPSFKLNFLIVKIQLKEYLKSKKINEIYPDIRAFFTKKQKNKVDAVVSEIESINHLTSDNYIKMNQVATLDNRLKRYINDFLYTSKNHADDISIYKAKNSYIIKGKDEFQKVSFIK
ncbi:GNAT family N-acetyltransferase [Jejuia spongiicola]|uniref:GNAT family N-acetyltransferase n=1 Tax=Jejuia spongiicola TaxID=2942207 RepID=A0ABT0QGC2_9FLAO|nr:MULTISPECIES: GNAT family N-acetyltransferase [Flavobacteriaceae]MCL6294985.1 GNAT family N-acetyltransferase [Jejuia spongiicola]PIA77522.1 hypothetical protein BFR04_08770 [Gaetbulibacter sp. 4G1]